MNDDDRIDDLLRDATRGYNEPPDVPREEMWQRIQAGRQASVPKFRPRWIPWAAAAAALLAVGIGLGRLTVTGGSPTPVAGADVRQVNPTAYRLAAQEHLGQSEAFLTLFRASVTRGGDEQLASATARQLLASNRLLLDSPAATDRKTRHLLEDLELVLAEIAQLSPQSREQDLELIRQGIDRGHVMSRLRTAVPAGTTPTQGAL
jgi:hypothetical protein